MRKKCLLTILIALLFVPFISLQPATATGADKPFIFGLLLVGPYNDHGYSQAHYEGAEYVQEKVPGTKMIYIDKVNPADRPGVTIPQLVDDMVEKGAKLIIANSDDMKDGIREAAMQHPDINFVHVSGDDVLTGKAPKNLLNIFGRMEYGKMMAGFSAAMTTKTGKIAYLGPLINEETRRLASSCYLGARYAWEHVLKKDPKDLTFQVTWIGFWFNIPGVTADPTQVAQNFFNTGFDVVVSGIDTTEAVVVANQKVLEGKQAWAIPYDYVGACEGGSKVCLGVPYFNWGPAYVDLVKKSMAGSWTSEWIWLSPDWKNINNHDTSTVGFMEGDALSADTKKALAAFISDLGSGKVNLFKGPLNYQDGSTFLKAGEVATDQQIWYMAQLLEGMLGQSSAK
ncbi:MAG TPA: BMP family ABC transporter substrate-binding protein [Deltaproteobacteria bacterium]|nr:BMP family ABC transporter substrate-binding protein [Deltaproteobacteria bacterium]HPJ95594.1 BMP family ABC transporter substrate-binding protein [Deltaproteobacteria bacterium]HPR52065.1 BMP family ABC transporter substrate-binding protein [Deltaproteobacteria bacterium]